MRIFFYEFITGGGMFSLPDSPAPTGSLLREGLAMRNAFAADLVGAGHHVTLLHDGRLPFSALTRKKSPENSANFISVASSQQELDRLTAAASQADLSIVLAPEFDSLLLQRFDWCAETGTQILGRRAFIEIASNKNLTADWLASAAVPVVSGVALSGVALSGVALSGVALSGVALSGIPGESSFTAASVPGDFEFPAVLKPADGAGSLDTSLVADMNELLQRVTGSNRPWRLERFQPGFACSVAVIGGPNQQRALTAASQKINSADFTYSGGKIPLPNELNQRATDLAVRAVRAMGGTRGYTGIDLILSDAGDFVVDVNPRLTTSYVALRHAYRQNLASAILEIGLGGESELSRTDNEIEFDASGRVDVRSSG
ncbi:MAG: putative ATP-grasp superfamily ATP-dependent carboligase [Pirellulaceae bacterium]